MNKKLIKPVMLVFYDPMARIQITTDASMLGLGAVLMQQDKDKTGNLLHLPLEH